MKIRAKRAVCVVGERWKDKDKGGREHKRENAERWPHIGNKASAGASLAGERKSCLNLKQKRAKGFSMPWSRCAS